MISRPPCAFLIRLMLTKFLFTIIAIVVVLLVYSASFRKKAHTVYKAKTNSRKPNKVTRAVLYSCVVAIAVASSAIFFYKWQVDNTIVSIRVISGIAENATTYKALRKDIKGRTFTTLDGRLVTLGESDRVEILKD